MMPASKKMSDNPSNRKMIVTIAAMAAVVLAQDCLAQQSSQTDLDAKLQTARDITAAEHADVLVKRTLGGNCVALYVEADVAARRTAPVSQFTAEQQTVPSNRGIAKGNKWQKKSEVKTTVRSFFARAQEGMCPGFCVAVTSNAPVILAGDRKSRCTERAMSACGCFAGESNGGFEWRSVNHGCVRAYAKAHYNTSIKTKFMEHGKCDPSRNTEAEKYRGVEWNYCGDHGFCQAHETMPKSEPFSGIYQTGASFNGPEQFLISEHSEKYDDSSACEWTCDSMCQPKVDMEFEATNGGFNIVKRRHAMTQCIPDEDQEEKIAARLGRGNKVNRQLENYCSQHCRVDEIELEGTKEFRVCLNSITGMPKTIFHAPGLDGQPDEGSLETFKLYKENVKATTSLNAKKKNIVQAHMMIASGLGGGNVFATEKALVEFDKLMPNCNHRNEACIHEFENMYFTPNLDIDRYQGQKESGFRLFGANEVHRTHLGNTRKDAAKREYLKHKLTFLLFRHQKRVKEFQREMQLERSWREMQMHTESRNAEKELAKKKKSTIDELRVQLLGKDPATPSLPVPEIMRIERTTNENIVIDNNATREDEEESQDNNDTKREDEEESQDEEEAENEKEIPAPETLMDEMTEIFGDSDHDDYY